MIGCRRIAAATLAAIAVWGCPSTEPEVRIVVTDLPNAPRPTKNAGAREERKAPEWRPSLDRSGERPAEVSLAHPTAPAAGSGSTPPARDLPTELSERLGDPSSCFSAAFAAATSARTDVHIEAVVIESGMVTRASVRAAGLDEPTERCLRRRVESARLPAPVPAAPRTIVATVSVTRATPPPPGVPEG